MNKKSQRLPECCHGSANPFTKEDKQIVPHEKCKDISFTGKGGDKEPLHIPYAIISLWITFSWVIPILRCYVIIYNSSCPPDFVGLLAGFINLFWLQKQLFTVCLTEGNLLLDGSV